MSVINLLGFYLDVNENKSYKGAELFQTLDFLNFSGLSELSEIIIRNVQQTWDTRADCFKFAIYLFSFLS